MFSGRAWPRAGGDEAADGIREAGGALEGPFLEPREDQAGGESIAGGDGVGYRDVLGRDADPLVV